MTTTNRLFVLAFVAAAAGCSTKVGVHPFPSSWPPVEPPAAGASKAVAGPTVWVEPLVIEQAEGQGAAPAGGAPTSEILTDLLVQKLRAAGIQVSGPQANYRLEGVIPWIGYTSRAGYPRQMTYQSGLAYRLVEQRTGRVLMNRQVEHAVEQSVVVNTMTRLPHPEFAQEQQVLERALAPTWEMTATGVHAFLKGSDEPVRE